jgi:hypothetical protein
MDKQVKKYSPKAKTGGSHIPVIEAKEEEESSPFPKYNKSPINRLKQ